jgi:dolichyl-phosphate beta-glucosyltransferase
MRSPDSVFLAEARDDNRPSLSLVVPLFNEEARFQEHAAELAEFIDRHADGSELIFVDDGSADRTVEVVQRFVAARRSARVRLIRRRHLGKGAAICAGLEAARGEYAAFCDVDLATPLDDLDLVVVAARMTGGLVVASRGLPTSGFVHHETRRRELLGRLYNRLVQLTLTPGISDTQCGAKAAPTALWHKILSYCSEKGFAWDVEAISIAQRLGFAVREVGVQWTHDERTRVRVARDGAAMVLAVPRLVKRRRLISRSVEPTTRAMSDATVFDDGRRATLLDHDTSHWWFRSKSAIVASVLGKHAPKRALDGVLLDIGAGAGGVTARLGWRPDRLVALEGSEGLVRAGRDRHALHAVVGNGDRLPFADGSCSAVTLLDVIEHLPEPDRTLREAWRVLAPHGCLVITVPAHRWLWSLADEALGHHRRYTRPMLRRELAQAGFHTAFVSHVFSWLVAPVWVRRRMVPRGKAELGLDQTGVLVDAAALVLTGAEHRLIKWVSLPLGTSIVCAATKGRVGVEAPRSSVRGT